MNDRQNSIAIDLGAHVANDLMVDLYRKINERLAGEDSAVKGAAAAIAIGVLKGRIDAFMASIEGMADVHHMVSEVHKSTVAIYARKEGQK